MCVCVRARMHAYMQVNLWVWGCCFRMSISLSFLWLSMCSNMLLRYWFLCEYLCILCLCSIKWQSAFSCWTRTINSMLLLCYIIISWLWHQSEFDISVQFMMPQWGKSVEPHQRDKLGLIPLLHTPLFFSSLFYWFCASWLQSFKLLWFGGVLTIN